jgi:hypothetical protein
MAIAVGADTHNLIDSTQTEATLVEDVVAHLHSIGLSSRLATDDAKDTIRSNHRIHRRDSHEKIRLALGRRAGDLLSYFASGSEVDPANIRARIEFVRPRTESAELFRMATLLWSVPVSAGFGRRIRMLVWDDHNDKVIGLVGLTDPVFNLKARDSWVGWDSDDRRERLVHVMDAHVLGAVPPYNEILGGKLITALLASDEVRSEFDSKYGKAEGLISRKAKEATLALVTVTSSLGRSSLYNRMRLQMPETTIRLERIGMTSGYGHFQVSSELFDRLRAFVLMRDHPYANGYKFGNGPNWRMRVIRVAFKELGLDPNLLNHGIGREVFGLPIAENFREILQGTETLPRYGRLPASEIARSALARWVVPRAERRPGFLEASVEATAARMGIVTR